MLSSCVCFVSQVKAKFTVDDHSHYLFTPCVLTEWVLSLLRYDLTAGNQWLTMLRFLNRFFKGISYV